MSTTARNNSTFLSIWALISNVTVSEYVARRDTVYLVKQGMDPHTAVARVMDYHRRLTIYMRVAGYPILMLLVFMVLTGVGLVAPLMTYLGPQSDISGSEAIQYTYFVAMGLPVAWGGAIGMIMAIMLYPAHLRKELCKGIPEWDQKSLWGALKSFGNKSMPDGWMESKASRKYDKLVTHIARWPLYLLGGLVGLIFISAVIIGLVERHTPCGVSKGYVHTESCGVAPPSTIGG